MSQARALLRSVAPPLVVGVALRVALVVAFPDVPLFGDELHFQQSAHDILAGDEVTNFPFRPPLYVAFCAAVMALFGGGNVLLKVKRASLPRPIRASWPTVLTAIGAVVLGLLGNARMNPEYLKVFFEYFVPTALVVIVMLTRIDVLKGIDLAIVHQRDRHRLPTLP